MNITLGDIQSIRIASLPKGVEGRQVLLPSPVILNSGSGQLNIHKYLNSSLQGGAAVPRNSKNRSNVSAFSATRPSRPGYDTIVYEWSAK
jgi:hypothetical protein